MENALREREEFKLKAAKFLLGKLKKIQDRDGHIKGKSYFDAEVYVESFLFHIIGSIDAFLQYLNSIYNLKILIKEFIKRPITSRKRSYGRRCPYLP